MMLPNSRYDRNIAKCGKQNLESCVRVCVCVSPRQPGMQSSAHSGLRLKMCTIAWGKIAYFKEQVLQKKWQETMNLYINVYIRT